MYSYLLSQTNLQHIQPRGIQTRKSAKYSTHTDAALVTGNQTVSQCTLHKINYYSMCSCVHVYQKSNTKQKVITFGKRLCNVGGWLGDQR